MGVQEYYRFLFEKNQLSFVQRLKYLFSIFLISGRVDCPHTNSEILKVARYFLLLPKSTQGVLVECGSYKGGSTAKLSILAKILNRKLFVFDSFAGLPKNFEIHSLLRSDKLSLFKKGTYKGTLREVISNVREYGDINSCEFVKGYYANTLPKFNKKIAGIYVDVDLLESNKTVLKYLYQKISKGGFYFCHDGHLKIIADLYNDKNFWKKEIGTKKPRIEGLYSQKLIMIKKK